MWQSAARWGNGEVAASTASADTARHVIGVGGLVYGFNPVCGLRLFTV